MGSVPASAAGHSAAVLRVPLPAHGAGVPVRGLVLVVLRGAGVGATGAGLQGHRGVRRLFSGRPALYSVPGSGSVGGSTSAARVLPQSGPQHRRSQPVLQRGPPQVCLALKK